MGNKILNLKDKQIFNNEIRVKGYRFLYITLVWTIVFHLLFSIFDYYLLNYYWLQFLTIRLGVSSIIIFSIAIISIKRYKKYILEAFFYAITIIEIAISYMLPRTGTEILPYTLGFSICFFVAGVLLRNLKYLYLFFVITIVSCVMAFILWPKNMDIKNFITIFFFLSTTMVISLVVGHYLYSSAQKEFIVRKKLEEAKKKLESLDEMKNDFIANITHDFRSPLMVILNLAEISINANKEKKVMENIYESGVKLKSTIDKLLDLAKMDASGMKLTISKVDPALFLEKISHFYSSSLRNSGIRVIKKFPDFVIDNFYTDIEKLEEVFNNIISNAIKFIDYYRGKISINLHNKGDLILFSIEDNGIGILEEKLDLIFNRFEQADGGRDSKYRGSGIGLAYAKQLVELMNGKIWAESKGKGRGAAFYIEFNKGKDFFVRNDLCENEIVKIPESLILQNSTDTALKKIIQSEINKKIENNEIIISLNDLNKNNEYNYKKSVILIVDDDKQVRNIIVEFLMSDGYVNFIIAPNGKLGLDAVYQHTPDLIISDYNMPSLRGDVFHDRVSANPKFKKIPFIFLTAVAEKKIMLERIKKGACAYLEKPIDRNYFLLTIEHYLKK